MRTPEAVSKGQPTPQSIQRERLIPRCRFEALVLTDWEIRPGARPTRRVPAIAAPFAKARPGHLALQQAVSPREHSAASSL